MRMRLVVFVAVVYWGSYLSDAMPINDCRDHYEYCGQWVKQHFCHLDDYRAYMNLVCPYSCGICDDLLSGFSASGDATLEDTVSEIQGREHRLTLDADTDFEDVGSTAQLSNEEADKEDESQSLSGSGDQPLFPATVAKEAESPFNGEADQQNNSSNQQEFVSGSAVDITGANFWAVVRVEPDAVNGRSNRELRLSRRSEKSTTDQGSGSGVQSSGVNVSQKNEVPVQTSSGDEGSLGGHQTQRSGLEVTGSSDQDAASGEDDAPFDNSSADSELDSGCSSGDGCYESENLQEEEGGESISRSVIAKVEQDAIASGSATASGDTSSNVWRHPHFDVLAGPYEDNISGSASVSELGNALHDIEDAIFETGIPLKKPVHSMSASVIPKSFHAKIKHDFQTSGSGSEGAVNVNGGQLFSTLQHHKRINLMEKMMNVGKLKAFKISHITTVAATNRDHVPGLDNDNLALQSDLGKGRKVSFVLNQDFHNGYENENSAAYNILANNVKREVEKALGSNAVVSEISFSEVREPAHGPRFSKVLTSLKLLGDVIKLEKMIKKGSINNLVVDEKFFHAT